MKKIDKKSILLYIMFAGFCGLFISFLVQWIQEPYGIQSLAIFNQGRDFFADFFNVAFYSRDLDPYHCEYNGLAEKGYLPFSYLIFYGISRLLGYEEMEQPMPIEYLMISSAVFMIAVCTVCIFFALAKLSKLVSWQKILLMFMLVFSGVFLFSFERGNTILLTVLFCTLFLLGYESENKFLRELSYLALAAAAALKGYPCLLGLLVIYNKDWKAAVRLIIYGLLFAFVPFFFMQGGIKDNISLWMEAVKLNSEIYQFSRTPKLGMYYFIAYGMGFTLEDQMEILAVAKPAVSFILILGLFLNYFQTKPWKRIALIMCSILIYPANCALYCALYLFPVIVLFFNEERKKISDGFYILLFLMILSPLKIVQIINAFLLYDISLFLVNLGIVIFYTVLLVEVIVLGARWLGAKVEKSMPEYSEGQEENSAEQLETLDSVEEKKETTELLQ
ncbi:MAG: glycosyltransferase 87 family protein [Bacteroides sp.]|nr:glycosyltransferase 87 family protein [Bacteroides sp.]MCM1548622.1 glycosyltransferase 87 family protein [Clostridium sp.]